MKKTLKTLLRISGDRVKNLKRELLIIQTQKHNIEIAIASLQKGLEKEKQLVRENHELAFAFSAYTKDNLSRQDELNSYKSELIKRVEMLQEQLFEEFSEQKKFELTLDNQITAEVKIESKQEIENFNELAIRNFRNTKG